MSRTSAGLFLAGLVTLLGQMVLLREQLVASFGSELAAILALGTFLLGGAGGALCGRITGMASGRKARILYLTLALLFPSALAFLRGLPSLLGAHPGAFLPLSQQVAGLLAVFISAGFCSGLLFQCLATLAGRSGRSLAWAYAVESVGSLAGGLLATFAAVAGASNLMACLGAAAAAAFAALLVEPARRGMGTAVAAITLLVFLTGGMVLARPLDIASARWSQPGLVALEDTPYARLTLTRRLGQVAVFQDRALLFETEGTSAEEFVHPAALQVANPHRILLLGGGAEGTLGEALKHHPGEAVLVEMDEGFHRAVLANLPPESRRAFADSRVRVKFGDPRAFLRDGGKWDLILVGTCEPSTGQANRFFTLEFFRLAARQLNAGGVLALRLRSSENLWTPLLARRNSGVVQALRGAFGDVLVLPGTTDVLLAVRGAAVRDPETLIGRLRERDVRTRLVGDAYLRYALTNPRVEEAASLLSRTPARPNSDVRPSCYAATAALWLSRFLPEMGGLEFPAGGPWRGRFAVGAAVAVALALAVRRRELPRRASLAFVAGFVGMVLESALILAYQAWEGALYRDMGLLVTLFMVGLSLGAFGMEKARESAGPKAAPAAAGFGLILCCGAAAALATGPHPGQILGAFLVGGGLVTGALFASAAEGQDGLRWAGALYGADMAGACLGAALGGLVAVPLLGMVATSLTLAGTMAVAVVLALGRRISLVEG